MKKLNWYKIGFFVVLLAMVLVGGIWAIVPGDNVDDNAVKDSAKAIKIGVILPLTGDAALLGKNVKQGTLLALEELKGKTKNSYKVVFEDDKLDNKETVTAYRKLTSFDDVDAVFTLSSGSANAIAPLAEQDKLLMYGIGSDPMIVQGRHFVFKHWVTPEAEAERLAEEVEKRGFEKIALITTNQQGEIAIRDEVLQAVGEERIVVDEVLDEDIKDFRTSILKAKEKEADLVVLLLLPGQVLPAVTQLEEASIDAEITSIESFEMVEDENGILEGKWYVQGTDATDSFTEDYRTMWKEQAGMGSANGYDVVKLMVHAFEQEGDVVENSYRIKDFPGALGTLNIDPDGSVQSPAVLKEVQDGKFVQLD